MNSKYKNVLKIMLYLLVLFILGYVVHTARQVGI